ncbi:glycerate kinase [Corynebacterium guangdongense]|uniref:Glycerate kinase n=1 Tax=Corynebacterium guangdongense TaxID=1783348 RepID=A0ABU1ZVM9_9CORY|nr:glycerate kinase [Corynebacterium guangdongense]MDR7328988.1 glycerate kinase [Corynebacterium guangdongense]WJZ17561.1 Glycerate 2-kinase [Corynebacterium guangdongense]
MRVLVAPDSFKGTFTAAEAAELIAAGARAPGATITLLPLADGGEGTLAVLAGSAPLIDARTVDPWNRPITASFAMVGETAVVELARASGLHFGPGDPVTASTYGTGLLIAEALDRGARKVLIAAGGSATTDGGVGAVRAITERGGTRGTRLTVLTDVTTPFEHAAVVFGPQKGATPAQVGELTARLNELASSFPKDPRGLARTGAAGGFSGGLWAHFDAELVDGAGRVLDVLGFDELLACTDLVVVGEGRLDAQTGQGKIIDAVLRRVAKRVPVVAVVGSVSDDLGGYAAKFAEIIVASTAQELRAAGARLG